MSSISSPEIRHDQPQPTCGMDPMSPPAQGANNYHYPEGKNDWKHALFSCFNHCGTCLSFPFTSWIVLEGELYRLR
ncbi:hypothetical protein SERLA73DRAFT_192152 [Serpula lacrymans var. lacrymans S7.3]|uniref:Uncharacterized protein n=2 Tax=Serpula lacrymans var. lacrymans TaxID=341189 RepID=F8QJ35_SERL3|nr:uncharacterized protein SERLADRAFT_458492 [Serpula lacrymans var. lacrymans S7.9]EGN91681.1 hypothetical protein SERLA73DRAFT_192152 [Serpula lacrymans var. lacrymans S7.3]EGO30028.1 hypothetical protein SERLADRAFT_458492 [Serpula lacrymans var. lacrymans S7.9]